MVRDGAAKGQVRWCGSKPEACRRGRTGLKGALEFKSWRLKGHVHLDLIWAALA